MCVRGWQAVCIRLIEGTSKQNPRWLWVNLYSPHELRVRPIALSDRPVRSQKKNPLFFFLLLKLTIKKATLSKRIHPDFKRWQSKAAHKSNRGNCDVWTVACEKPYVIPFQSRPQEIQRHNISHALLCTWFGIGPVSTMREFNSV